MTLLQDYNATLSKSAKPSKDLRPGAVVKVHQRIVEMGEKGKKERTQVFEGLIIAKHGSEPSQCTITVRKISNGVGVERIFPLISPSVEKIEVVRQSKVRRAKLYYLRDLRGKATKLKELIISEKDMQAIAKREAEEKLIHAAKVEKGNTQTEKEQGAIVPPPTLEASAEPTPEKATESK